MFNSNDHTHTKIISSLEDAISLFRECNNSISVLHQYSSDDFMTLNAHIKQFHKQATVIVQTIATVIEKNHIEEEIHLCEQAKQSLLYISRIVTRLQFHDIIRQKLEHIQDTNQLIIAELLDSMNNKSEKADPVQSTYIPIIPDIIRLHVAQLQDTNHTYKQAFAEIKAYLQSFEKINHSLAVAYSKYCETAELERNRKNSYEQIIFLAQKLSAEITASLAAIQYCDPFDALINRINHILTTCTMQLLEFHTNHTGDLPNKTLKNLEFLYTMESERIIFNQVIHGGQLPGVQQNKPQDDTENIELF